MVALSLKPETYSWSTIRFPSTLYTRPILDILVADVPTPWQAEVRLGLQEALINAIKHGNGLDPSKQIIVKYSNHTPMYQWLITDQGCGFASRRELQRCMEGEMAETDVCGRGTFILTQIFDYVEWNGRGNQLYLGKYISQYGRQPTIC